LIELIRGYCSKENIPWKDEGLPFLQRLQAEAMANAQELASHSGVLLQRMWTSALQLRGREFCFILNAAVRSDDAETADPTAGVTRAINQLCVTAGVTGHAAVHPPGNVCFRGGGFDDRYRSFFATGRQFRQPAYLATSFSQATADGFMARSTMPSKVRWLVRIEPSVSLSSFLGFRSLSSLISRCDLQTQVRIDAVRKCVHVNLVTKRVPGLPDEQEYLFAPYSAFTVLSVAWNAGTNASPHVIELLAAPDNREAPEDLPLAPWS
jgi:hypothetical protein